MTAYSNEMANLSETNKIVRDSRTGRLVEVRGAGAGGRLTFKKGIDLTKPIFEQAAKSASKAKTK